MNLIDYGRIILRRGWILVLLAVLTAGGAYAFSQTMQPVYRASVNVLVTPSRTDNGLLLATVQILNNRKAWLESNERAQQIIDELRLDVLPGVLRGNTNISANRDDLTIQIEVFWPDPAQAGQIAAAWGNELIRYNDELNQEAQREDRIRMALQDQPQVGLDSPNDTVNTLIGGVTGLFLGAIIVFVLEYLESSIVHRREDVERSANLKVLATVPTEA